MSGLSSKPRLRRHSTGLRRFGTVRQFPLGLTYEARMDSPQRVNHHLADTQILNTSAE
jgi:starvation-inducible DNA-binding protein